MIADHIHREVLAEYQNMRNEILQLNRQAFITLGTTLTLDAAALGWFIQSANRSDTVFFVTIGSLFLTLGSMIIINRDRVSHRLAMYQRYRIEPVLEGVHWAKTYLAFRRLSQDSPLNNVAERLAGSSLFYLSCVSFVNLVVVIVFVILTGIACPLDVPSYFQLLNIAMNAFLFGYALYFKAKYYRFDDIEKLIVKAVLNEGG